MESNGDWFRYTKWKTSQRINHFQNNRNGDANAATAVTYHACARIVFAPESNYQFALLENVVGLGQKPSGAALSDAEWIVDEFGRNGWACAEVELEASEFGSSALRLRKYLIKARQRRIIIDWSRSWFVTFIGFLTDCFWCLSCSGLLSRMFNGLWSMFLWSTYGS